ncbi:hypothetical protein KNO15_00545 [Leifsonia shinshuensis]|uniref:hypothetical protein n=1 Tax=Leifsonia shinshuensis TaxID=150026 RepID=UPI001F514BB2|nr:hypothetical protein [Leifsonia shinshuensis]MCI0155189.1 hypothetical protein [Leifsonia shinshuensis]
MTDTTVPLEYRIVVTEEVARRCARAAGRYLAFRRQTLVLAGLYVFFLTLIGIGASMLDDAPVLIPVFVVVGVVLAVGFPVLQFVSTARSVRRQLAVGEEWATGFGAASLRVETPRSAAETHYSMFDRLIVQNDVVLLRRRAPRVVAAIPVELMPPEAQHRVAAGLSGHDPR